MFDNDDRRHRSMMISLCLLVLILILAFFYDLYRSAGKSGEAVSHNSTSPAPQIRCTSGQLP
jgi:hypothetical protein